MLTLIMMLSVAAAYVMIGNGTVDSPKHIVIQYTTHAPIYINNDSDFVTQGYSGDGSESSPYNISGYEINANSVNLTCISIRNTTKHFLVDANWLHHTGSSWDRGAIFLSNVTNGTVSNNIVEYSNLGIRVVIASNILITGNNCSGASNGSGTVAYGIYVYYFVHNISVIDNKCYFNGNSGITLRNASSCTVSGNQCSSSQGAGIVLRDTDYSTITYNNASYNWNHGLLFFESPSDRNNFMNNTFYHNEGRGVSIGAGLGQYNRLWNNTFYHNNDSGDDYNPAFSQATDAVGNNYWNTTSGYGNWWSDLTKPDNIWPFGIVDWSYNISGGAAAKDMYPLTEPGVVWFIPEFADVLIPVAGLMLIALALGRTRKKMRT